MVKISVRLPPHLHRALEEAARVEKKPQADVMRRVLEEYLGRRERPLLLSAGIGEDTGLSGADSEDWLRDEWGRR